MNMKHPQHLEKLNNNPEAQFYKIHTNFDDPVQRYIVSTPQTRDICNKAEVVGIEYTDKLKQASANALKFFPNNGKFKNLKQDNAIVMHFLRGGLNFGLRDALHMAFGFNNHMSSFMSSQRFKDEEGRWDVKENMYRKFKFPKDCTIFIGDIVATGVTVDCGIRIMLDCILEANSSVKNLVFFTIGCHKIEKVLVKYDKLFREHFPDYEDTIVIYFEGKFKLIDSKTELKIGIPGTDLIRKDCLIAPEFELSQYDDIIFPLGRCTIYDAGSRSFDIQEYLEDVVEYWENVKKLAENGFTLFDALKERFPEEEYETKEKFIAEKKNLWKNIDDEFLENLFAAYNNRWTPEFLEKSKTTAALLELCNKRLEIFSHVKDR